MKRFTIVSLLGISMLLLIDSCNTKAVKSDSKAVKSGQNKEIGKTKSGMTIAFYYQDSIPTQFHFYHEIDSIVKQKELAFQKELESKINAFQSYQAEIQKRYNANEITGYEIDGIKKTMAQKQQSIETFRNQKGGALQNKVMQYQIALTNKIAGAAKDFAKEKGIDLLLYYQKGGQVSYINDSYDVTQDFMNYLNAREKELKSGFQQAVDSVKVGGDSLQLGENSKTGF